MKSERDKKLDTTFNNNVSTVVDYLSDLYKPLKNTDKKPEETVDFDGFGTEHARFLLKRKE